LQGFHVSSHSGPEVPAYPHRTRKESTFARKKPWRIVRRKKKKKAQKAPGNQKRQGGTFCRGKVVQPENNAPQTHQHGHRSLESNTVAGGEGNPRR